MGELPERWVQYQPVKEDDIQVDGTRSVLISRAQPAHLGLQRSEDLYF